MSLESKLYGTLAPYYDRIYHWKDYEKDSCLLRTLIKTYKKSSGKRLLDVACGTGRHIQYLRSDYECVGLDASDRMLAVARENVPGVRFVRANMVDFSLGECFDVVTCLFSSIGYLRTRREVDKAVHNLVGHMKVGGVLIVEPWVRKSGWRDKSIDLQTFEDDTTRIARVNYGSARGTFSILDERYLIAEKDRGIIYVRDRSRMRFFEPEPTLRSMREAGLNALFTEESLIPGRGLLVGVKLREDD
jgi:SAM-dependent methyltransferase